jgi:hypothetical protein
LPIGFETAGEVMTEVFECTTAIPTASADTQPGVLTQAFEGKLADSASAANAARTLARAVQVWICVPRPWRASPAIAAARSAL